MKTQASQRQPKKLTLEAVFSSRGRAKILELLALRNELNISEIIRRTSLNHSSVARHLQILGDLGFILEKNFGRIKIYRYCSENINARALKNLILLWRDDNVV